jgi:hypothetical protein
MIRWPSVAPTVAGRLSSAVAFKSPRRSRRCRLIAAARPWGRTTPRRFRPRCLLLCRSALVGQCCPLPRITFARPQTREEGMHEPHAPVADLDLKARHLRENVGAEFGDAFDQRADRLVRFLGAIDSHQVIHALAIERCHKMCFGWRRRCRGQKSFWPGLDRRYKNC